MAACLYRTSLSSKTCCGGTFVQGQHEQQNAPSVARLYRVSMSSKRPAVARLYRVSMSSEMLVLYGGTFVQGQHEQRSTLWWHVCTARCWAKAETE